MIDIVSVEHAKEYILSQLGDETKTTNELLENVSSGHDHIREASRRLWVDGTIWRLHVRLGNYKHWRA